MSDSNQLLERFHRALIEEIQTQRPEYLTGPFTVAEIYQNLVPYGSHRDRIGVEMNGDYEDALLRLLAGEGGFLILESEPALRDLRAELDTPNPNTGLYREYAAVDVRLNQAHLDLDAAAAGERTDLAAELNNDDPVPMADLAPSESAMEDLAIVPPGVDVLAEEAPSAGSPSKGGDACQWCRPASRRPASGATWPRRGRQPISKAPEAGSPWSPLQRHSGYGTERPNNGPT